jgi:hypothetical protein
LGGAEADTADYESDRAAARSAHRETPVRAGERTFERFEEKDVGGLDRCAIVCAHGAAQQRE